jgi:LPS sulfotransferase NodH
LTQRASSDNCLIPIILVGFRTGFHADWEDWFHATERDPIRVFCDEFTVSRAETIGRGLNAPGIDPPAPEGKKPMERQSDELSSDWVARLRAERQVPNNLRTVTEVLSLPQQVEIRNACRGSSAGRGS